MISHRLGETESNLGQTAKLLIDLELALKCATVSCATNCGQHRDSVNSSAGGCCKPSMDPAEDNTVLHALYKEASTRRHTADAKEVRCSIPTRCELDSASVGKAVFDILVLLIPCALSSVELELQAEVLALEFACRDASKLTTETALLLDTRLKREVEQAFEKHQLPGTGSV